MEPNENITENQGTQEAQEAELNESLTEEADDGESLESFFTEEATEADGTGDGDGETEDADGDEEPQGTGGKKEPGYVKGRIDKAVQKAIADTEARLRAEFDQRMAPYREQMLTAQAHELVRSGKVKDLETAKELVRYRQGQAQPAQAETNAAQAQQPRNAQGQFTTQEQAQQETERDQATQARIDMLQHQADRIKGQNGPDVIAEFRTNEETRNKVVSGEWDFYDVAEMLKSRKSQKRTPAPMRSPNGASGSEKSSIASMTDAQFEKLQKSLDEGKRYTLK